MARSTSADLICAGGINSLINEEGSYLPTLITMAESLDLAQSSVERRPARGKAALRSVPAISSASIVFIIHE